MTNIRTSASWDNTGTPVQNPSSDTPGALVSQCILAPDSIFTDAFVAFNFPFPAPVTPPSTITANISFRVLEGGYDTELVYVGFYDGWTFRNNMVNYRGTSSPSAPIADYNSQFPVTPDTQVAATTFSGSASAWGVVDWSPEFWSSTSWGVALIFSNFGNGFNRTIEVTNVELTSPEFGTFHANASIITYPWVAQARGSFLGSGVVAGDGSAPGALPAICSLGDGRCNTSYLKTYGQVVKLPEKQGKVKTVRVSYVAHVDTTAFTQELYFGFFGRGVQPPKDENNDNTETVSATTASGGTEVPGVTPLATSGTAELPAAEGGSTTVSGVTPLATSGTGATTNESSGGVEVPGVEPVTNGGPVEGVEPATNGGEIPGVTPVAGTGERVGLKFVWYNNVTDASVYSTNPTTRVYEGAPGFWGVENWTADDWGISVSYMKHSGGQTDVHIDSVDIELEFEPEEAPPPEAPPEEGGGGGSTTPPETPPEEPPAPPPPTPTPPETPPTPPQEPLPPVQEPTPPPETPLPPVQPTPPPPATPPGVTPGFDPGFIPIVPLPSPIPPKPGEPIPDAFGLPCVSFCVGWERLDESVIACAWKYEPLGCGCGHPESHVDKPCPMNSRR